MTNSKLHTRFLNWWLRQKIDADGGFSLTEALVAIIVLAIAFTVNLQFLVTLKIKNLEQEIETAAVSLSKEIMDDIRYKLQTDLNNYTQGLSQPPPFERAGYQFNADVYVCTSEPTIASDQTVTCISGGTTDIRYIVVQVIDGGRKNEKLYTVESVFTKLQ